jgi:hypothetical protein
LRAKLRVASSKATPEVTYRYHVITDWITSTWRVITLFPDNDVPPLREQGSASSALLLKSRVQRRRLPLRPFQGLFHLGCQRKQPRATAGRSSTEATEHLGVKADNITESN